MEWVIQLNKYYIIILPDKIEAYIKINADEVNFLCGRETQKGWKIEVDMEENKLEFKE